MNRKFLKHVVSAQGAFTESLSLDMHTMFSSHNRNYKISDEELKKIIKDNISKKCKSLNDFKAIIMKSLHYRMKMLVVELIHERVLQKTIEATKIPGFLGSHSKGPRAILRLTRDTEIFDKNELKKAINQKACFDLIIFNQTKDIELDSISTLCHHLIKTEIPRRDRSKFKKKIKKSILDDLDHASMYYQEFCASQSSKVFPPTAQFLEEILATNKIFAKEILEIRLPGGEKNNFILPGTNLMKQLQRNRQKR